MSTRRRSSLFKEEGTRDDNQPEVVYYSFNHVIYDWIKSLSANPQWKNKSADLLTLKSHLDIKNWFPKEAKDGLRGQSKVKSLFLTLNLKEEAKEKEEAEEEEEEGSRKKGIELLIGHFEDSRMKLLLSSNSVESFAQQLHQSGQTSKLLPLPLSMTAAQSADIQSIERAFVTTEKELSFIQGKVSKNNKIILHEENMNQWSKEYEEVRRIWRDENINPVFCGFDVETYEYRHKELLEVGWSIVGPRHDQESFHYIIEEAFYQGLHNGRHVPDYRREFLFGKVLEKPVLGRFPSHQFPGWTANGTEVAFSMDVGRHFSKMIRKHRQNGPVFVVFHDSKGDMKVLEEYGVDTRDWSYALLGEKVAKQLNRQQNNHHESNGELSLSDMVDSDEEDGKNLHPVFILDTQLLFAAIRCNGKGEKRGLKFICTALDVNGGDLRYFHNAANDAHYTAAALVKMAEGPHFTTMRSIAEERIAIDAAHNIPVPKKPDTRRRYKKSSSQSRSSGWD